MLYALLRSISAVALRWFYSRVDVEGLERIPPDRPLLLAVNHPNALIDALVVGLVFPRRLVLTARATLFSNPISATFFRLVGVVPLIRTQDVADLKSERDARRNEQSFAALKAALARGRAVLLFPEGVTGDHPSLAPLRTGVARIALQAKRAGVGRLGIVPIGLTFERKDVPRSRVFVEIGNPIDVDSWASSDPHELTAEIDRRLREITLNYQTLEEQTRTRKLSAILARLLAGADAVPPVWQPDAPFAGQVQLARRVQEAFDAMSAAPSEVRRRAEALLERVRRFNDERLSLGLAIEDLEIALGTVEGTGFVLRELPLLLVAGPVALWGWVNHVIPFHVARVLALRSIESAADPAMRTVVNGLVLVLLFYGIQTAVVYWILGPLASALYLVSLPLAADINFYLRARLRRALLRARTYLRFRRRPELQRRVSEELRWLRRETLAVDLLLQENLTKRSATESMQ